MTPASSAGATAARVLGALLPAAFLLWLLGRIQQAYYLGTFGIDPGLLGPPGAGLLLDGWFPAQNALFFAMMLWLTLRTRLAWVGVATVVHGLLPIAGHYAFAMQDGWIARALIDGRHTALKLLPFAVLAAVWAFHPSRRAALHTAPSPPWPAGRVIFLVVVVSWAISTAKHSGSFDALLAMRRPDALLARVDAPPGSGVGESPYLIGAGRDALALWDPGRGATADDGTIRAVVVPRDPDEPLHLVKKATVQRGRQWF